MKDKCALITVVGIGNSLAGDDSVGPEVLKWLEERYQGDARLRFLSLQSDLFALADHLGSSNHFVFLDAIAGEIPGFIQTSTAYRRGFAASLHQTDLAAVMNSLESLGLADPFPTWEVWGVTIEPPREYRQGLSPVVSQAALRLVEALEDHLSFLLSERVATATHPRSA